MVKEGMGCGWGSRVRVQVYRTGQEAEAIDSAMRVGNSEGTTHSER